MQRAVDNVLAITKESVKTVTYESLHNVARLVNGVSALLLAIMPGKASVLEGLHGWELRPTFRGPRLPHWMENGVSSFNKFIHELSMDSDTFSNVDYSSGEDYSDDDDSISSPLSQSCRASRASNFGRHDSQWGQSRSGLRFILTWLPFPSKFLSKKLLHIYNAYVFMDSNAATTFGNLGPSDSCTTKKAHTLMDHIVQRAIDKRRGLIEDLHVGIEIFIEDIFYVLHKAARYILSPLESFEKLLRWLTVDTSKYILDGASVSDSDQTPTDRTTSFHGYLNTDARTCRDVITGFGIDHNWVRKFYSIPSLKNIRYPYEAISIVTADGYVLLLERIPRRDATKVVYLQHGLFDSSMGWVSNGVVGSPAFAAFDQGYDVFLGNFRGLVSRDHVNKNISSRQYWRYSINEHGTEDIPAMIEKIHEVKLLELRSSQPNIEEKGINSDQPYKLCAICHSLGGAGILMYAVSCRIEEKPHRLSRLILLSPAGFHHDSNFGFYILEYVFRVLAPIMEPLVPGLYIPTRFFRMVLNKLARDLHNYPAVGGLVQTIMSYCVGGDSSNWIGVLGLPHFNMNDMPGVSFRVALHFGQILRSGKFIMFDYGSAAANYEIYGCKEPLDVGEYYDFIDIPVDLVAGRKDQVIRPSMVREHYNLLRNAGVEVSYREFEYAHLDFTFSHREELLAYVMSRLLLMAPAPRKKSSRMKKKRLETNGECK